MKKLYGVTAAMITPISEKGTVDLEGTGQLTDMLIDKGVSCLYPCGTTGEMLRLSVQERKAVAERVVERADGRVPVYIHCGAMRQEDTIELLRHARSIGADGAGVVTPQYFMASDRELMVYYEIVAKTVQDFPVYLYVIPQCAGNDISAPVAERIAEGCPNIIGIKYSFADINRTIDYLKIRNGAFSVLHGCDRAMLAMLSLGCAGVVSGVAGVFPEPFVKTYGLFLEGKLEQALKMQKLCVEFCDALKCGCNMSYFKQALRFRNIAGGVMRKPQLDIEEKEAEKLERALVTLCEAGGFRMDAS